MNYKFQINQRVKTPLGEGLIDALPYNEESDVYGVWPQKSLGRQLGKRPETRQRHGEGKNIKGAGNIILISTCRLQRANAAAGAFFSRVNIIGLSGKKEKKEKRAFQWNILVGLFS